MVCLRWHEIKTNLAWLLLQRYCTKSASSRNQIACPTQEAKCVMMHTAAIADCTHGKGAKHIFVSNAQYLTYWEWTIKLWNKIVFVGTITIIADVNLYEWKHFTECISPTTWRVSFMEEHAKKIWLLLFRIAHSRLLFNTHWKFFPYIYVCVCVFRNSTKNTFRPTIMMFTNQMFCGTL